jgi:RNA ligase (TIGR02306 family)
MSRKLASVQRIKAIKPIEGADRIECVQVLNWDCVVSKDQFRVGDWVIYFEIDSLLPDIPAFEFLKGSSWSQKLNKYKISTHKFRNQISQGLVIPYDQLKELTIQINGEIEFRTDFPEGEDLTELLKIEKYEPPVSNGALGDIIQHEWYVPKTDEERIQVCAENVLPVYMKSEQDEWYASVKLDGTSCTAGLFEDRFLIGGRNQFYKDENMYTTTVKKYGDLQKALETYRTVYGLYVVFQGELCGPGIQSNRLGLKEKEWFVFNAFVSKTGKMDSYIKCDLTRMLKLCEEFGLKHVPIVSDEDKFNFKTTTDIDETVNNLLKYVDNIKYRKYFEDASPNQIAEGLVFRTIDMTNSFKVVSNKYLLKGGE